MAMLILSREIDEQIRAERRARGIDQHDEVWEGVYVMAPDADNEHQVIVGTLTHVFHETIVERGLGIVCPGTNISDRDADWTSNFRVPDVAVFLRATKARDRRTHWVGGPDLAIEIVSEDDRSREKLGFYAQVGTRELLIIDRDPWGLELYRLAGSELVRVGTSTLDRPDVLASEVVPLEFRLVPGEERPVIEATRRGGEGRWTI